MTQTIRILIQGTGETSTGVQLPDAVVDAEPEARRFFDSLSYSNRRRFTYAIDDAKTPETRQRRIEKSVAQLREGKV